MPPSLMDAIPGSFLGEYGLAKDKAVFNMGNVIGPFTVNCREWDGGCLSFSASSPLGVSLSITVGGSNRTSGFSREVGKNSPYPSSHVK